MFINRELSWLEFNHRVLEEACDKQNPLLERLKFAAITASNLDEFFMIRVASIRDKVLAGFLKKDPSGLLPTEEMEIISHRAHQIMQQLYHCYTHALKRSLKKEKIHLANVKELDPEQQNYAAQYFEHTVYPVLTPMLVDSSRPFPLLLNKSLNIALLLANPHEPQKPLFATVQVPSVLKRIIEIPASHGQKIFVLLEEIIKERLSSIFSGHKILTTAYYRITRNADLSLDEEGAEDLLAAIKQSLRQRKWGSVIRLEIESSVDQRLLERLTAELEIDNMAVYKIPGPIDLNFLHCFYTVEGYDHLRYMPIDPVYPAVFSAHKEIFDAIRIQDITLHHPYHSFQPVLDFVRQAAADPQVLAIKQTLYRVSGSSPLVEALAQAAENGKQVTVLVELKARFDEENNIQWAKRLETAGCHVIYGLTGLKTHCKILLVVRMEDDGIQRYVHLSTGNYNDATARYYTDIGLFTANPYFGADASNLFNMLSGLSEPAELYRLSVAPYHLRKKLLTLIRRETTNVKQGKKAAIIAKVNSLVDREIIETLYDASKAGVTIKLIVRGICCLKPGVPNISDNIQVYSIVGRYLEHSRIYYFLNDGNEELFLSSADLMERNLDRRIEILFPVDDPAIKQEMITTLSISLNDTQKARKLAPDGQYTRVRKKNKHAVSINSQDLFYENIRKKQ